MTDRRRRLRHVAGIRSPEFATPARPVRSRRTADSGASHASAASGSHPATLKRRTLSVLVTEPEATASDGHRADDGH